MTEKPFDEAPQFSVRDVARVLFRHRRKAAVFFATVVGLVSLYSIFAPSKYMSDAKLLVRLGRESVTLDPTVATGHLMSVTQTRESQINSELEIIRSREVASLVVRALGPELFGQRPGSGEAGVEGAVEELLEDIEVEALQESNVVKISYESRDPGSAQKVVAKVIEVYLDQHIAAHRTSGSYEFFVQETERIRDSLGQAEERLRDLKNMASIGALDEQRRILLGRIGDLEKDRQQAMTGLSGSQAKVKSMREMLTTLPETLVTQETSGSNSAADAMRAKLYDLQLKEQDYLSKFREDSDPVREVRRQIAEAESLIDREGRKQTQVTKGLSTAYQKVKGDMLTEEASLSAFGARARALEGELDKAKTELKLLNENEVQMAELERQITIYKENYRKYSESMEQARIDQALETERISNISVVQPATFLADPVSPRRLLNILLALVLGLLGGVGIAVGSEFLDQSMSDQKQVEDRLSLRTLVAIPELHKQRVSLLDGARPRNRALLPESADVEEALTGVEPEGELVPTKITQYSETLWNDLTASANGAFKSPCILAVTSCHRGEGVSTVAASIAASLRMEGADRVLLVDAKAIRRSSQNGHMVLPASAISSWGKTSPDVHRAYEGRTSADLLALLKREDSFVVLDTPPVLEAASSLRLCSLADGVVLVVEAESTRWQVAQEAKEKLHRAHVNLLGVVLNKRRFHIPTWLYRKL